MKQALKWFKSCSKHKIWKVQYSADFSIYFFIKKHHILKLDLVSSHHQQIDLEKKLLCWRFFSILLKLMKSGVTVIYNNQDRCFLGTELEFTLNADIV